MKAEPRTWGGAGKKQKNRNLQREREKEREEHTQREEMGDQTERLPRLQAAAGPPRRLNPRSLPQWFCPHLQAGLAEAHGWESEAAGPG